MGETEWIILLDCNAATVYIADSLLKLKAALIAVFFVT